MALNSFSLHTYAGKNAIGDLRLGGFFLFVWFFVFFFFYGAGETRNKTVAFGSGFEDHLHQPEKRGSSGGRGVRLCIDTGVARAATPLKAPAVQQPPACEMNRRPRGAQGDRPASSNEPSEFLQQGCGVSRWKRRCPGTASSTRSGLPRGGRAVWEDTWQSVRTRQVPGWIHTRSASFGISSSCTPAHQHPGSSRCRSCPARPSAPGYPVRTGRIRGKKIQDLKNPPGFNSKVQAMT